MAKHDQEIPKALLRQINENTNGGFVLFYIHKDNNPKIFSNFDSNLHASALNYFIQNWAKAIEAYNIDSIVGYMSSDEDDRPPTENGGA